MHKCRGHAVKVFHLAFVGVIVRGAHWAVEGAGHEASGKFFAIADREVARAFREHPGAGDPMHVRQFADEVCAGAKVRLSDIPFHFFLPARRRGLARVPAFSPKTGDALGVADHAPRYP